MPYAAAPSLSCSTEWPCPGRTMRACMLRTGPLKGSFAAMPASVTRADCASVAEHASSAYTYGTPPLAGPGVRAPHAFPAAVETRERCSRDVVAGAA
eukprot:CAMPEP_0179336646 /NCGR_PEP_ID=MMETSP0797-20121207/67159_1 /TAXON_ID=47934 /ORGANISM="Dinophysis acuminata, Strain DAEP01" /LENGTH=96 /DNA_ID=CAMNT_0021050157 /DNA_START=42 /DNA_END=329 /DNA_ORIENTATION=-